MTVISIDDADSGSARMRLVRAADAEIADRGIEAIQMEAIAKRAGMSRATAFRQLGSISEAVILVALLRAERHIAVAQRLMDAKTGVFEKIEASFVYCVRELPKDPAIAALMARRLESKHDPRAHGAAMGSIGLILEDGQRAGEVRGDLPLDEMVGFIVEQLLVAAEETDRTESAVRKRIRHFVVPALEARSGQSGELLSSTREVERAISVAVDALQTLAGQLRKPN